MEQERKPDVAGRVNGFDVGVYQLGQGIEIALAQAGQEIVVFRYTPQGQLALPALQSSALVESQRALATTPAPAAPATPERSTTDILGAFVPLEQGEHLIEGKEGEGRSITGVVGNFQMGQTPTSHEDMFLLQVREKDTGTDGSTGGVFQIATYTQVAKELHQLTQAENPQGRLVSGEPISLFAFYHEKYKSWYPSSITYKEHTIRKPKPQKNR